MAAVDKVIEEQLAALVQEREARKAEIRERAERDIQALDDEIEAVRKTIALAADRKGRKAS